MLDSLSPFTTTCLIHRVREFSARFSRSKKPKKELLARGEMSLGPRKRKALDMGLDFSSSTFFFFFVGVFFTPHTHTHQRDLGGKTFSVLRLLLGLSFSLLLFSFFFFLLSQIYWRNYFYLFIDFFLFSLPPIDIFSNFTFYIFAQVLEKFALFNENVFRLLEGWHRMKLVLIRETLVTVEFVLIKP